MYTKIDKERERDVCVCVHFLSSYVASVYALCTKASIHSGVYIETNESPSDLESVLSFCHILSVRLTWLFSSLQWKVSKSLGWKTYCGDCGDTKQFFENIMKISFTVSPYISQDAPLWCTWDENHPSHWRLLTEKNNAPNSELVSERVVDQNQNLHQYRPVLTQLDGTRFL